MVIRFDHQKKGRIAKLSALFFFLVVAMIVLSVAKDFFIKAAIEMTAPSVIGSRLQIGSFALGIFTQKVRIKNLKLYNPPGFPDEAFLFMPEIAVDVNIQELMRGKMHFPLVIFNMGKVIVVKDKEGQLNVDSLKIVQEQMAASKGKPTKLPEFKIDILKLNIGQIVVKDYSHAPSQAVEVYNVAIKDKVIRNIDGAPKLVASVMVEALKPTAIRSAGLMAATTLLGVGFLPAVAFGVIIATDDAKAQIHQSFTRVYQESLKLVQSLGIIKHEDLKQGQILAKVYGCDITITIHDKGWGLSDIVIKARKYMLAKPEIAAGLLYQLEEKLK